MATRQKRRTSLSALITPLAAFVFLGYFGFHAFNGSYGLRAHAEFQKEAVQLREKLKGLREKRTVLEARVQRLKDGTIEFDMVDERARHYLNLVHQDEIVIMRHD